MPNSGSPISFDVTGEQLNGVARLHARGELDLSTTPLLERAFTAVEELQPATIVLDFQYLAFIDSTRLQSLLRAHARATESGRLLAVINGALLVEGWSPIAIPGTVGG